MIKIKSIAGKHADITPDEDDVLMIVSREKKGIEVYAPDHPDNLDLGQAAMIACAAMIARDRSMAEIMVEWGKANDVFNRTQEGEFDLRKSDDGSS